MKKISLFIFIVIIVLGLAQSTKNFAQNLQSYSLKDLCDFSDNIVVTQIKSLTYLYDESKGRIITEITCSISEHLKGNHLKEQKEFKMLYPGGVWGEMVQFIPGAPSFKEGEKSILFLKERYPSNGKVLLSVIGMSAGKFNIIHDKTLGIDYLQRDKNDQNILLIENNSNQKIYFDLPTKISVTDFKKLIKKLM